jgi:hypothetical protein
MQDYVNENKGCCTRYNNPHPHRYKQKQSVWLKVGLKRMAYISTSDVAITGLLASSEAAITAWLMVASRHKHISDQRATLEFARFQAY